MERGGVEGRILALACLRVAGTSGVGIDALVDDFRNDRHRRYIDEGERLSVARSSIPNGEDLTQNPYDSRPGPSAVGTYGSRNKAVISGGPGELFKKRKRRPSWK
jgi:hypothetical protein